MKHYQDINGGIHALESAEFEHLLPAGCIPITDEELAAIRAAEQAVVSVPQVVTMDQARRQLIIDGKLTAVKSVLDAMDGIEGELARSQFEFAPTVRIDHPLVLVVLPLVGYDTGAKVNALFTQAFAL